MRVIPILASFGLAWSGAALAQSTVLVPPSMTGPGHVSGNENNRLLRHGLGGVRSNTPEAVAAAYRATCSRKDLNARRRCAKATRILLEAKADLDERKAGEGVLLPSE